VAEGGIRLGVLENRFKPGVITTTADFLFNWAHRSSMWPMILGTACCAIEMMAVGISRFDMLERFGMLYRFSPRQSDVMLVCGTVTKKFAPVMRTLWDQMGEPKWCIAVGNCASAGGPFPTYAVVQGIDEVVPVDIYIPGCPPIPEAMFYGIMKLQEKIKQDTIAKKVAVDATARSA
jgi:NADH-quinone oxidoreductase subunit B